MLVATIRQCPTTALLWHHPSFALCGYATTHGHLGSTALPHLLMLVQDEQPGPGRLQ